MSYTFEFATVPFDLDGDSHDLYKVDPEDPQEHLEETIEGVTKLGFGNPNEGSLWMRTVSHVNENTEGYWQAFLVGGPLKWDSNGRFVVLDKRRIAQIGTLRMFLPRMKQYNYHDPFKKLLDEIERQAAAHPGRMVALVIN